ncbi:type II secretion system protein GspE [Klebsiella pneumoniae]|nr:type II secretion system protein GspE [Klebsiella pneumoniae]
MTPAAERRPLLPFAWARAHHLVLLSDGERCEALCRPDTAARALLEARRLADGPMRVSRLAPDAFEKVLVLSYQRDSAEAHRMMADIGNELDLYTLAEELPDTDDLLDSEDDAPIIRLINAMLTEAIKEKASDIHIETYERHLQIRFRVDGVLREILRPQRAIDVRVSTLPSSHGERVVLRLLDKNSVNLDLLTLGMPPALLDRVDALIARPHGIILVTGPTGSGKSTTLYAALSRLDARERNIMTIEDPVEYELEGIGQTQVNAKVEMTFARGLRAILRQDPDVVLVGEIRDGETAQIAVQASLTGHLVLSTLHTNSALGAISRLQDMGVEPFLLSTSLLAVMSQRLVRQLCPHCRQPWQADANTARQMAVPVGARLWQPKGCPECNFIGYRGRTGIHELLLIDDRVRAAIHRGENELTLIQQLGPAWQTLRHAGRDKALAGITSWEEVMRVTEQQTTESV